MRSNFQIFASFMFVLLLLGSGVYTVFFLDLNQWKRVGEVRLQLAERQAVVKRLNELIQKFREQLAMFDDLDQQINLVGKALPASLKIPELLVSLESMAQENEISLRHVSFTVLESSSGGSAGFYEFSGPGITGGTEPYPISIAIDGSGNYLGMKKFFQGIETELRLMEVKTLEIIPVRKSESSNEATSFGFKLNLEAYSIKKPQFTLP